MNLDLDYHHIAVEEQREREGVQKWRSSLTFGPSDSIEESDADPAADPDEEPAEPEAEREDARDSARYSEDPVENEEMERKLRIINAISSRCTLKPAYEAAIPVYQSWLECSVNTADLSPQRLADMTSQCDLYQRVLDLYDKGEGRAAEETSGEEADLRFLKIHELIQQAKALGEPPQVVEGAMSPIVSNPSHIKQQSDLFNKMLDDIVAAFGSSVNV